MAYSAVGAATKRKIASSIHPMGLPGRRAATSVPTAAADTVGTAATSQSITGPPGAAWWMKPSIGTLARPIPRVNTPNTTAATCAVRRGHKLVLTAMPLRRRSARNEQTIRADRSGNVTAQPPARAGAVRRGSAWSPLPAWDDAPAGVAPPPRAAGDEARELGRGRAAGGGPS